jgi:hypothetical protein
MGYTEARAAQATHLRHERFRDLLTLSESLFELVLQVLLLPPISFTSLDRLGLPLT